MIPDIGIGNVGIGQPNITSVFYIAEPAEWMLNPSVGVPPAPPVTVDTVSYTHLTLPTIYSV